MFVSGQLDSRNEKTDYMIREAQLVDRVPYMLIVGQKEVEDGTVSIRSRDTAKTETMTLDNFTLKSQMKSKIVYKKEPDTQTQSL